MFFLYNEKSIQATEYNYVISDDILIKEAVFFHKNRFFIYQIQVHKISTEVKYNWNRYIEQMLEGIHLKE